MSVSELDDLFDKQEPLHPDLVPYIEPWALGKTSMKCLRHPLIYEVPYFEQYNTIINARYAHTLERVKRHLANRDWEGYVWDHERPYRFEAFQTILQKRSRPKGKVYWKLLADVWIDSENIWQNKEEWAECFEKNYPYKQLGLMNRNERKKFSKLPMTLSVYRGGRTWEGLSWTLSYEKAKWFAERLQETGSTVHKGVIERKYVWALFTRRGEEEVVFNPKNLLSVE